MKFSFHFVLAVFFFCAPRSPLQAQWLIQTKGPYLGIQCFAVSGTNLFVGTNGGGVFLTTDNGTSWSQLNSGLPALSINALAVSGTNVFGGSDAGIFLTTNNGASWTTVKQGLPVFALAVSGTNVFAGTSIGVFRSVDSGATWSAVNGGLPTGLSGPIIYDIALSGTKLFAATDNGVFLSTNNGAIWTQVGRGLTSPVLSLAVMGSNLFALSQGGMFLNIDTDWKPVRTVSKNDPVSALTVSGTTVFAGTYNGISSGGVFLSNDNGTNWTDVTQGLTNPSAHVFCVCSTSLFAGTDDGIWRRPLSEMVSSAVLPVESQPSGCRLEQNFPNPFNPNTTPSTTIRFDIPERSFVSLRVFDALGKEVSVLACGDMAAGTYERRWEATKLPGGIYYYRLQAGSFSDSKEIQLLR